MAVSSSVLSVQSAYAGFLVRVSAIPVPIGVSLLSLLLLFLPLLMLLLLLFLQLVLLLEVPAILFISSSVPSSPCAPFATSSSKFYSFMSSSSTSAPFSFVLLLLLLLLLFLLLFQLLSLLLLFLLLYAAFYSFYHLFYGIFFSSCYFFCTFFARTCCSSPSCLKVSLLTLVKLLSLLLLLCYLLPLTSVAFPDLSSAPYSSFCFPFNSLHCFLFYFRFSFLTYSPNSSLSPSSFAVAATYFSPPSSSRSNTSLLPTQNTSNWVDLGTLVPGLT